MGRFDLLTQLEKKTVPSPPPSKNDSTPIPEHHFTSKPAKKQTSKEVSQQVSEPVNPLTNKEANKQTSLPTNQFPSKEVKQQISKETNQQTTKEKKKYGTYLREDSITAIQMLGVQTKQKDHVVLQEIVDFYFANKK